MSKMLVAGPTLFMLFAIIVVALLLHGISKEKAACNAKGGVLIPRTDMCINKQVLK